MCSADRIANLGASLATPLAAYVRVPLSWYHSTTYAFFPDETHSSIRRVYEHAVPDDQPTTKRQFCGYCGTPLTFWSEQPPSEADFIHLTLGSLSQEDLADLQDMGLVPEDESEEEDRPAVKAVSVVPSEALTQTFGVPWLHGLMENTKLGKLRRTHGVDMSADGRKKVTWEVVEYTGSSGEDDVDMSSEMVAGKRKLDDRDD